MSRQFVFLALPLYILPIAFANASETYTFYAVECELEGQKQCSPTAEVSFVVNPANQSVQLNDINLKTNKHGAAVLNGCRVTDEKNFSCEENKKYSDTRFIHFTYGLADGKFLTLNVVAYPPPKTMFYFIGSLEYYWRKWAGRWTP